MTIIEKLDQAFVDRHLQCREGVARAEFVDPQRTGLYILVSASSPGQGTYFLRYKDATGKKGDERKAFMKECLSAKPAAPMTQQSKMKMCNADEKAKTLKGDERKKFMSECLKKKP